MSTENQKTLSYRLALDSTAAVTNVVTFRETLKSLTGVTVAQAREIKALADATKKVAEADKAAASASATRERASRASVAEAQRAAQAAIRQQRGETEEAARQAARRREIARDEARFLYDTHRQSLTSYRGFLSEQLAAEKEHSAQYRAVLTERRRIEQEHLEKRRELVNSAANAGLVVGGVTLGVAGAAAQSAAVFGRDQLFARNNTRMSAADAAVMERVTRQLGARYNMDFGELSRAFMRAGNFGFTGQRAANLVTVAAESAAGTGGQPEKYAEVLAGVMSNYKLSDPRSAMNQLHQAALQGNMTVEELVSSGGPALAFGAKLGAPMRDVLAMFSTLTGMQIPANQVNTLITSILPSIVHPTPNAQKTIAAISKLSGVDLTGDFSLAGLHRRGLSGVIQDVQKATAGGNEADIFSLFNSKKGGGLGMLLAATNLSTLQSNERELDAIAAGREDPTREGVQRFENSPWGQEQKLAGTVRDIELTLGKHLLPPLQALAHVIDGLLERFEKLSPGTQTGILDTVLGVGAAAGAGGLAVKGVQGINALRGAFGLPALGARAAAGVGVAGEEAAVATAGPSGLLSFLGPLVPAAVFGLWARNHRDADAVYGASEIPHVPGSFRTGPAALTGHTAPLRYMGGGAARLAPMVAMVAEQYGLDPRILSAIIHNETGGDPRQYLNRNRNGTTDYGVMQVNSATLRDLFHWTPAQIRSYEATGSYKNDFVNMHLGAQEFLGKLRLAHGDLRTAFRMYNGSGPAAERYANRAMAYFEALGPGGAYHDADAYLPAPSAAAASASAAARGGASGAGRARYSHAQLLAALAHSGSGRGRAGQRYIPGLPEEHAASLLQGYEAAVKNLRSGAVAPDRLDIFQSGIGDVSGMIEAAQRQAADARHAHAAALAKKTKDPAAALAQADAERRHAYEAAALAKKKRDDQAIDAYKEAEKKAAQQKAEAEKKASADAKQREKERAAKQKAEDARETKAAAEARKAEEERARALRAFVEDEIRRLEFLRSHTKDSDGRASLDDAIFSRQTDLASHDILAGLVTGQDSLLMGGISRYTDANLRFKQRRQQDTAAFGVSVANSYLTAYAGDVDDSGRLLPGGPPKNRFATAQNLVHDSLASVGEEFGRRAGEMIIESLFTSRRNRPSFKQALQGLGQDAGRKLAGDTANGLVDALEGGKHLGKVGERLGQSAMKAFGALGKNVGMQIGLAAADAFLLAGAAGKKKQKHSLFGGILGAIGGAFLGNPVAGFEIGAAVGGAFAAGGIAPGGRVSLVGEKGPELILPAGDTRVVDAASTRAALGGHHHHTTNHIYVNEWNEASDYRTINERLNIRDEREQFVR